MADKYVDHGLYNDCAFTASRATTTLTVTAVSSGRLALGTIVWTDGSGSIANNTCRITAYGTGTGGAGTYTVNQTGTVASQSMVGRHGSMALAPEWGVAQNGDGTLKPAATPATISVDMTGWTFSTSSTVSIAGATVTCTASATTSAASAAPNAQYSATLTTMINNLVTAINFHSGSVVSVPSGHATNPVRDTVFARRNGNALEIMTRAGSADWNGLTGLTFASVTGSSSRTWGSGVGGAWGHFATVAGPILPYSANAAAAANTATPPAGSINPGDVVYIRNNGNYLPAITSASVTLFDYAMGTVTSPVVYVVDDASVWVGDSVDATMTIEQTGAQYSALSIVPKQTSYFSLKCAINSDGSRGLALKGIGVQQDSGVSLNIRRGYGELSNILLENASTLVDTKGLVFSDNVTSDKAVFKLNKVILRQPQARYFVNCLSLQDQVCYMRDVEFDNTGSVTPNTGVFNFAGSSYHKFVCTGLRFEGFVPQSALIAASAAMRPQLSIMSADLGNVTVYGGRLLSSANAWASPDALGWILLSTNKESRDFLKENQKGLCEWISGRAFPYLNARLPTGTGYSLRVLMTSLSSNVDYYRPFELPQLTKYNTLADGARTVTVRFASEQTLAIYKQHIEMVVSYIDTAGDPVSIVAYDNLTVAPDLDSGSVWSVQSDGLDGGAVGQVKFDDGGLLFFNKHKISVQTPAGGNMKAGTEVRVVVSLSHFSSNVSQMMFFDPDFDIT